MQPSIKGTSIRETFKFSQELGCTIGMVRGLIDHVLENQDNHLFTTTTKEKKKGGGDNIIQHNCHNCENKPSCSSKFWENILDSNQL